MTQAYYHEEKAKRIFTCRYCGHRMRLGAETCGECYQPARIYNHKWFLILVPLLASMLAAIAFSYYLTSLIA